MKKIVKRCRRLNYESSYDVSSPLITRIAASIPGTTDIAVALRLGAGEVVEATDPFGEKIEWTIEEVSA